MGKATTYKESSEYLAWKNMHSKGSVCEEWYTFTNFLYDMGRKPSTRHVVTRRNSKIGFTRSNCYWQVYRKSRDSASVRRLGKATVYQGNARDILPIVRGATAIVTDPPYELNFMGKEWDASGIAFDSSFWKLCLDSCLPGAYLLCFGGSRTYHRIACAIEDAGWEIRDCIMWLYGSGFPKSLDVGKAIDKRAGVDRKVIGSKFGQAGYRLGSTGSNEVYGKGLANGEAKCNITAPATDEAKIWKGYGTSLKPAFEPIIVARKSLIGSVVDNVKKHKCGALNIDRCRIASNGEHMRGEIKTRNAGTWKESKGMHTPGRGFIATDSPLGRWPANIIHDNSEEVLARFPNSKSVASVRNNHQQTSWGGTFCTGPNYSPHNDSGSAGRFFYTAKASQGERMGSVHPTIKPLRLMKYLCRLVKQPERNLIVDPFAGSGSTLLACEMIGIRSIGIELDRGHCEDIVKRLE